MTSMLTAPGTAWDARHPSVTHRVWHGQIPPPSPVYMRGRVRGPGLGVSSQELVNHTRHTSSGLRTYLTISDSNTYKPVVKCHNPSHGTAHILLTCRDLDQSTALRTEKGDITTRRAAAYQVRASPVTWDQLCRPAASAPSFRCRLEGSTKLSACPLEGLSLAASLTNLVLPVLRSSCHLMLHQARTASACSLQHLKHQMQCQQSSAEHCAAGKLNTHATRDPPRSSMFREIKLTM